MQSENERRAAYETAAAHLPPIPQPETGWRWTEREVDVLRKACAVRFGESLRTESLFQVANAAIRIYLARAALKENTHAPV